MRFALAPFEPSRGRVSRAAFVALLFVVSCKSSADARGAANGETVGASAAAKPGDKPVAQGVIPDAAIGVAMGPDSNALRAAADSGRILGSPSAKVWMIMASDFQCPYCKMWHDQSFEVLRKEYVDGGKVRMAYMNFPLDQHVQAMPAAEAAMCASAQGKFWPYHTALFTTQADWEKAGDQSAKFEAMAKTVGVDGARFHACTQSHVMRAMILADRDRMASRGVQSTPSFFIGAQTLAGAIPTDEFRRAIDGALAQAR